MKIGVVPRNSVDRRGDRQVDRVDEAELVQEDHAGRERDAAQVARGRCGTSARATHVNTRRARSRDTYRIVA